MVIKLGNTKALIYNLLRYTGEIWQNPMTGFKEPVLRTAFNKNHHVGVTEVLDKVAASTEFILKPADTINEKGETVPGVPDMNTWVHKRDLEEGQETVRERFAEEDIDFDAQQCKAIKYYYNLTQDIADVGKEAYDEFKKVIESV